MQFAHQGHPVCLLTNLSRYPTVLGPDYLKVSADLFGAVREQLEQLYHVPVF